MITMSRPVWGAWIEMDPALTVEGNPNCRVPCGARGLKSPVRRRLGQHIKSRPVRGAWIEIRFWTATGPSECVASRAGRVD